MRCLVTGAAGFIGSHLCEALLRAGHEVVGVDAFIPYYPRPVKEQNLAGLRGERHFRFHELDLRKDPIEPALKDVEVVFHLAAMAGLIKSWTEFDLYASCNIQATQRLLEAIRTSSPGLRRLVYGSTSSVYGKFASGDESLPTKPTSPYGVTKLAAENLCRAYAETFGVRVVVLRYFSIYGPRQRPDMGYYKFIDAFLRNEIITVYGDGQQVRGNTYVDDCVAATIAAADAVPGETFNLGGGETASVWDILMRLEKIAGRAVQIKQEPARPGDQRYTCADTSKLKNHLAWEAKASLDEGLKKQFDWQKSLS